MLTNQNDDSLWQKNLWKKRKRKMQTKVNKHTDTTFQTIQLIRLMPIYKATKRKKRVLKKKFRFKRRDAEGYKK